MSLAMSLLPTVSQHAFRQLRSAIFILAALGLAACGYEDPREFFSNDPAAGYSEAEANTGATDEAGAGEDTTEGDATDANADSSNTDSNNTDGDAPGTDPAPPAAPTLATMVSGPEQLTLNWDAIDGAASYEVYYATDGDLANAAKLSDSVGRITGTNATIGGLDNAATYTVWIQPVDENGTPGATVELGAKQPEADAFTPDADAVFPPENAQEVDPNTKVTIGLSREVDPASVTSETVVAKKEDGSEVDVTVTTAAGNTAIEVTPNTPGGTWPPGEQISITVTQEVKDKDGNALPSDYRSSFGTVDPASLSAWFSFDGANPYVDASPNGFNLTGPDWVTTDESKTGTAALLFPASQSFSDQLQLNDAGFDLGERFTISFWVKINTLNYSIQGIVANAVAMERSTGFKLGINNWNQTDGEVLLEAGDGSYGGKTLTGGNFVQTGNWYHFAFVVDTTQPLLNENGSDYYSALYFNGERAEDLILSTFHDPASSTPIDWTAMSTTGPFNIGSFPGGSYRARDIVIDDLRFYTRILEADEIKNLAR